MYVYCIYMYLNNVELAIIVHCILKDWLKSAKINKVHHSRICTCAINIKEISFLKITKSFDFL